MDAAFTSARVSLSLLVAKRRTRTPCLEKWPAYRCASVWRWKATSSLPDTRGRAGSAEIDRRSYRKGRSVADAGFPFRGTANLTITPPSVEASGANAAWKAARCTMASLDRDFLAAMASERNPAHRAQVHKAALAYTRWRSSNDREANRARAQRRTHGLTYAPDDRESCSMSLTCTCGAAKTSKGSSIWSARNVSLQTILIYPSWRLGVLRHEQANQAAEWQRSLELRGRRSYSGARQGATLQARGRKLSLRTREAHFTSRYSGEAEPGLAHEVLATGNAFCRHRVGMNYTPPERSASFCIRRQALRRHHQRARWVGPE